MSGPPNVRRGHPRQEMPLTFADQSLTVLPRCRICRHVLTAARSIERGIGPVCAKRTPTAPVLELPAVDVIVVKLCARCIREAS